MQRVQKDRESCTDLCENNLKTCISEKRIDILEKKKKEYLLATKEIPNQKINSDGKIKSSKKMSTFLDVGFSEFSLNKLDTFEDNNEEEGKEEKQMETENFDTDEEEDVDKENVNEENVDEENADEENTDEKEDGSETEYNEKEKPMNENDEIKKREKQQTKSTQKRKHKEEPKLFDCSYLNGEELQIIKNKLKEVAYWDQKIDNIRKMKKKAIKNKIRLHFELMESNAGTLKLKELESLRNKKMNEQLAVLARAQYVLDTFEKNINSNTNIREDNINAFLISLKNFKKHVQYTYLDKALKKSWDNCVSL